MTADPHAQSDADAFDLRAYLDRIGWRGPASPTMATLRAVNRAHLSAIPFENLDIQMGLPVQIDPASLQAALVRRRRGGYCFQQNGLFRLALAALGFSPRPCDGRVRLDAGGTVRPRTHMVLVVPLEGQEWLTDVGFGGNGLAEPIAIGGEPVEQDGWIYRTVREGSQHVLQRAAPGGWDDLYAFGVEAVPAIDYVMGNWYTSTHPDSGFVRSLTAQRVHGRVRHIVRNLTHATAEDGQVRTRSLERDELVPLLRGVFGLDVPADARFRAIDGQASPGSRA